MQVFLPTTEESVKHHPKHRGLWITEDWLWLCPLSPAWDEEPTSPRSLVSLLHTPLHVAFGDMNQHSSLLHSKPARAKSPLLRTELCGAWMLCVKWRNKHPRADRIGYQWQWPYFIKPWSPPVSSESKTVLVFILNSSDPTYLSVSLLLRFLALQTGKTGLLKHLDGEG